MSYVLRFASLAALALLASCAGAGGGGETQSFAAHIDGAYTAGAFSTSVR